MERDFLGVIGKEAVKEASRGATKQDSGYLGGGPAMQWPFGSKVGGTPPFMSFKSVRDEESKELVFDQFSLSGFRPAPAADACDGIKKQASPVLAPQKPFGVDSQGNPHYAVHGHRVQSMDSSYGAPHHLLSGARVIPVASHHSVQFNPNNPMFKVQSSPNLPNVAAGSFTQQPFSAGIGLSNAVVGSTVGVFAPRDGPKPKSAQMTIFYAGSVNVFDNVSMDKAQELMFLASRASSPSPTVASWKPDSPVFTPARVAVPDVLPAKRMLTQKPEHVLPPVSSIPSPISVVSQTGTLPRSASSSNNDSAGPKSAGPLAPTSQPASTQPATLATTTAATIVPRAVPQARKASLARFLEKRKERVSSVAPYPSSKSPLESSDTLGSANVQSKSSCTDIALSSNRDESLCLGQPRNSNYSGDSPSTKLQI